ncbi:MAG: glycosyltransferase [Rhizobiaceae bacterium]|uniref:glycosyltransferase n=1 Tax=Parvibaculum sp. TaxID=2024848 RepID=UPI001B1C57AB|nr:glycosyltransferase [Parvibaculum sp.]MBO6633392.1 glycosyltransferase [Parvibaculum sp.]MBO6725861.1 glycosyltransferase [Rhizobiaceae bacterium]
MRIWLATVGEPLPIDGEKVRLLRTGQFANWLSERGHEVVFWTGTMDHYQRRLRAPKTTRHRVNDNYEIVMLAGRLYRRSISYARFMNHRDIAAEFRLAAPDMPQPDIILTSFPTAELCEAVADYAEPRRVPFIVDARDFWPDLFVEVLPGPLRFLAPIVFGPYEKVTRGVFSRADAVSGMTESAMKWALRKAGREKSEHDFWHPFTYAVDYGDGGGGRIEFDDPSQSVFPPGHVGFCFFGTHSPRVNLEMFVEAFRLLYERGVPASLMLCGQGPATQALKRQAKGLPNVLFPGWINTDQIRAVMQRSKIGVMPYNTPDFFMNIPNKIAEYLSGGLAILSCTHGEIQALIRREGCGFWCEPEPEAIADEIARIVENPEHIEQAQSKVSSTYTRLFEPNAAFQAVVGRFNDLIEAHKR